MKKTANGVNPILALILTVLVAVLTVVFFTGGRIFWGLVCALITVDFCADALLSFRTEPDGAEKRS